MGCTLGRRNTPFDIGFAHAKTGTTSRLPHAILGFCFQLDGMNSMMIFAVMALVLPILVLINRRKRK